jgi:Ca2+-binding RTX toxin-like protein
VTLDLNEGASSNIGVSVSASGKVGSGTVSTVYTSTLTVALGAVVENAVGSAFNDVLIGNGAANRLEGGAGNDRLEGRAGNDVLVGGAGNNVLDGGDGVDIAVFSGNRAGYTIGQGAQGLVVSGAGSTDTLTGIERLVFNDGCVALDVSGSAGAAAKVIGAVFGAECVGNASYVGLGMSLLDNGMREQDLVQLALNVRLGANADNAAVVDLLFANLAGAPPAAEQQQQYVDLLDQGVFSQAGLGLLAADTALNAANIDLVGLSHSGIGYIG